MADGESVEVGKGLRVRARENGHMRGLRPGTRSLGYFVERAVRKLRSEFLGLPGAEIARLRAERGAAALTEERASLALAYSGDTDALTDGRYDGAEVLIHEATFLERSDVAPPSPERFRHSTLNDVLALAAAARPGHLVLSHFSGRYDAARIVEATRAGRARHGLAIPVSLLLPGTVDHDILATSSD